MITKPTVLVLGAGASVPYGFPSGEDLARDIVRSIADMKDSKGRPQDTVFSRALYGTLRDPNSFQGLIKEFPQRFGKSACASLDEFVQTPANRRFLELVKAATVVKLVGLEREERLYPADPANAGDWIEYLFRHFLRTDTPEEFDGNCLKVIMFNFDRSFERRLFLILEAYYGIDPITAANLRAVIQVLHLHGSLGGEQWLNEQGIKARAYTPEADESKMAALVDEIRIVHEDIPAPDLTTAHRWLSEAHTICFLGFGYHKLTMDRLRLNERLQNANFRGTTLGMSEPERRRVLARFGPNDVGSTVQLEETCRLDARRYIRETSVFQ